MMTECRVAGRVARVCLDVAVVNPGVFTGRMVYGPSWPGAHRRLAFFVVLHRALSPNLGLYVLILLRIVFNSLGTPLSVLYIYLTPA